jgi:hypothetical protein
MNRELVDLSNNIINYNQEIKFSKCSIFIHIDSILQTIRQKELKKVLQINFRKLSDLILGLSLSKKVINAVKLVKREGSSKRTDREEKWK